MKLLPLNTKNKNSKNYKKYFAIVDDEDFEMASKYNWIIWKPKNVYYAVSNIWNNKKGETVFLHRIIMGLKKGDKKQVDHKDGDGLNCQRENLRICNHSQNGANAKGSGITSKYRGVYLDVNTSTVEGKVYCYKRWKARVVKNKKIIFQKRFKTEIEAAKAYNEAAKLYHGEFARLNIIE